MQKCKQCNKPMNPVDFIISPVCLKCTKKNHNAVIGIYNKKSDKAKKDFIQSCFEPKPKSFYKS